MNHNGTSWGKVVGIIGLVASLIGIFAFITGKSSIPDIVGQDRLVSVTVEQPQIFDTPPTERSSPIQNPTATIEQPQIFDTPPTERSSPIQNPTVATFEDTNPMRLEGSPRNWVADSDHIPARMSLLSSMETSNEDIAESSDNPSEMFNRLENSERLDGYLVVYRADAYEIACSSETGLITIAMQVGLHQSEAGADGHFDYRVATEDIAGPYRKKESYSVGDRTYSAWFEFTGECSGSGTATEALRSDWIRYHIHFRRYNVLAEVEVTGVKGIISESELESIAIRLARLIDLKLVAQAE